MKINDEEEIDGLIDTFKKAIDFPVSNLDLCDLYSECEICPNFMDCYGIHII